MSLDDIRHFLITVDPATSTTEVQGFGTDYDAALAAYGRAERADWGGRLNIVLSAPTPWRRSKRLTPATSKARRGSSGIFSSPQIEAMLTITPLLRGPSSGPRRGVVQRPGERLPGEIGGSAAQPEAGGQGDAEKMDQSHGANIAARRQPSFEGCHEVLGVLPKAGEPRAVKRRTKNRGGALPSSAPPPGRASRRRLPGPAARWRRRTGAAPATAGRAARAVPAAGRRGRA